jgi:hypothetical protein
VRQGLRDPGHTSVDVDVWVEPRGIDRFAAELAQAGWRVAGESTFARVLEQHSVTYTHQQWPCEIDVHDRYPGFLVTPEVAFEAAWSRRTTVRIAEVDVPAPDRPTSAVIHALHRIRDEGPDSPAVIEFAERTRSVLTPDELAQLVEVAGATGASGPLAPYTQAIGLTSRSSPEFEEAMVAWRVATGSKRAASVPAVFELSTAPIRRWPRLLWHTLVLTEAEIRAVQPEAAPGAVGLFRARLRRIRWGLRGLPLAVSTVWRERRRSGDQD